LEALDGKMIDLSDMYENVILLKSYNHKDAYHSVLWGLNLKIYTPKKQRYIFWGVDKCIAGEEG